MPSPADPLPLTDLVAAATALARAAGARPGDALREARRHGREALDRGLELLGSSDAAERAVGCDLVGELCAPDDHGWGPEVGAALVALAGTEGDPVVLHPLARALGTTGSPFGLAALMRLGSHPDPQVRLQVAGALSFCDDGSDPQSVQAILVALMADSETEVRDWATFATGTLTTLDGPAVREALLRNTADADPETRDEAILGIARRRDRRAAGIVARRLHEDGVRTPAVEAACYLADPALLPALRTLEPSRAVDAETLAEAVAACDPDVQAIRRRLQQELLAGLEQALAARPDGIRCSLSCDRLELGVTLQLEPRKLVYDVDGLIEGRGQGDAAGAVRAVLEDLDAGRL